MSIQTSNLEAGRDAVRAHPLVLDAQITGDVGADRTLEIVLEAQVDRVPPEVLAGLATHDCGIEAIQRQGQHLVTEAI